MSKIEEYINNHRQEFDDEIPDNALWNKVAKKLNIPQPTSLPVSHKSNPVKWIVWAVAACCTGLLGIWMWQQQPFSGKSLPQPSSATTQIDSQSIASFAPEAAPEVNAFARQIAQKQQELKKMATEQPQLYSRFATDIAVLDSTYNLLQQKLQATPNKEMLIEAMMENLQMQLNILNQQLQIINEVKHKFKKV
jgi:hypothetical protein